MEMEYASKKNHIMAVVFGIFGGRLGLHRLYCGKVGTGLLYMFLRVFSSSRFFNSFLSLTIKYIRRIQSYILFAGGQIDPDWLLKDIKTTYMGSLWSKCGIYALILIFLHIWLIVDLVMIVRKKFKDKNGAVVCNNDSLAKRKKKN